MLDKIVTSRFRAEPHPAGRRCAKINIMGKVVTVAAPVEELHILALGKACINVGYIKRVSSFLHPISQSIYDVALSSRIGATPLHIVRPIGSRHGDARPRKDDN